MFELFCSVFLRPNPEWRVEELHSCDVAVASDVFSKEGLIRSQLPLHIGCVVACFTTGRHSHTFQLSLFCTVYRPLVTTVA